jgi:hypothetical protein
LVQHLVVEDHNTVFAESTGLRLGGVGPALVIELLEHGFTFFLNIFERWLIVLCLFLDHINFILKLCFSGLKVEFLNVMELGLEENECFNFGIDLNLIGVLGLEHLFDGLGKGLDLELEFGEEGIFGLILSLG